MLLSHLVGPHGAVHAFEPNPELADGIRRRVGGRQNVTIYEVAVADTTGSTTLSMTTDRSMSSIAFDHGDRHTTVETRPLSARIEHADICKIDIEGGEYAAIVEGDVLDVVDHLVCELHPHRIGPDKITAVYETLTREGTVTEPNGVTDIPMNETSHIYWHG